MPTFYYSVTIQHTFLILNRFCFAKRVGGNYVSPKPPSFCSSITFYLTDLSSPSFVRRLASLASSLSRLRRLISFGKGWPSANCTCELGDFFEIPRRSVRTPPKGGVLTSLLILSSLNWPQVVEGWLCSFHRGTSSSRNDSHPPFAIAHYSSSIQMFASSHFHLLE